MRFLPELPTRKIGSQQAIKEDNIKLLFNLVRQNQEISRAELVRITKLSPTTVSALVDELLQENLLIECGYGTSDMPGRKPINLRICPDGRQIPVFSLSRWGITYTLYDLESNEIETSFTEHLSDQYGGFDRPGGLDPDSGNDYCDIIYDIFVNKSRNIDYDKVVAVCITYPGLYLEKEQMLSYSAMRASIKLDALKRLSKKLSLPIFFGNSSMCLAYAEKNTLTKIGKVVDNLIYINVTDGVGAGIVYKNQLMMGSDSSAGEIGHVSIDYNGKLCSCGNRGCLEQYVNTDVIIKTARKLIDENKDDEILATFLEHYEDVTLEFLAQAYDKGVPVIKNYLQEIARMLYTGINSIVCITGIKQVVLGGGIERLGPGFLSELLLQGEGNGNSFLMRNVSISYAMSGEKGDSLGIAEYFIENVFTISL